MQLPAFAPGAVVTAVLPDGRRLVQELHAGSSYLSSEDPRAHFGLGKAKTVDELIVRYPGGRETQLTESPRTRSWRSGSAVDIPALVADDKRRPVEQREPHTVRGSSACSPPSLVESGWSELPSDLRCCGPAKVETLVGRQAELASLDEFLTRVAIGPCALFLEGEAGIGKTRVWREGVERARRHGARILSSQPSGSEVRLSFAGLADLLDEVVADALPELPPPQRRALEIALLLEDPKGVSPDDRAVAAAFLGCVRVLADAGPVLIAVDDIQWLDPASGRVLEFACRRLEAEPVGVLAAVRIAPDETEPDELARAFGGDRVEHLPLGPLTVAGLYELVRVHLDLELSRPALLAVHELSEGNPFFALELVRALQRAGPELVPGEPLPVPANLRELVRGRLGLFPGRRRRRSGLWPRWLVRRCR